jgi:hypothetical protein
MKNPKKSRAANGANIRLAADIGGTFTDIAVFDDKTGRLTFGKALSTPDRLVDGITAGVEKAGSDYASANQFPHGRQVERVAYLRTIDAQHRDPPVADEVSIRRHPCPPSCPAAPL